MAGKKLGTLLVFRRVLLAMAALLFCLTVASGVLYVYYEAGTPSQDSAETTAATEEATDNTATIEETTDTAEVTEGTIGVSEPVPTEPMPHTGDGTDFAESKNDMQQAAFTPNNIPQQPDVPNGIGSDASSIAGSEGSAIQSDAAEGESNENSINQSVTDGDGFGVDGFSQNAAAVGEDNEGVAVQSAATENGASEAPVAGESECSEMTKSAYPGVEENGGTESTDTAEKHQAVTDNSVVASLPQAATEPLSEETEPVRTSANLWGWFFCLSLGLFAVDMMGIAAVSVRIGMERKKMVTPKKPQLIRVGKAHGVGARTYQQDSLGHTSILNGNGFFAVVADGMGGLSNSGQVSQQIVMEMITLSQQLEAGQTQDALRKILTQVNHDVNEMLGSEGIYKSGSTVVAVLVTDAQFQWISVGDSRIYLFREGYANQLNRDHDLLQLWMKDILSGNMSYEEALRNPDGRKLTSFIGMGELRFVDASISPIEILPGDRIVLMSDGVYNVLSEVQLAELLKKYPDVKEAAAAIDRIIRSARNPHQDNYSALILEF